MQMIFALSIVGIICCIGIVACFIGHTVVINKTIRAKDREIAKLKMQLKRARSKDKVEVITVVQDGKHPQFGNF